jgi:hypothetical protein|tara:strand:+ start:1124 stop:1291 length:168 start_codon:yes stop_codon:yes gene_type:complete
MVDYFELKLKKKLLEALEEKILSGKATQSEIENRDAQASEVLKMIKQYKVENKNA